MYTVYLLNNSLSAWFTFPGGLSLGLGGGTGMGQRLGGSLGTGLGGGLSLGGQSRPGGLGLGLGGLDLAGTQKCKIVGHCVVISVWCHVCWHYVRNYWKWSSS